MAKFSCFQLAWCFMEHRYHQRERERERDLVRIVCESLFLHARCEGSADIKMWEMRTLPEPSFGSASGHGIATRFGCGEPHEDSKGRRALRVCLHQSLGRCAHSHSHRLAQPLGMASSHVSDVGNPHEDSMGRRAWHVCLHQSLGRCAHSHSHRLAQPRDMAP